MNERSFQYYTEIILKGITMKINVNRKSKIKRKMYSSIALGLLLAYTFIRHPDAESVTPSQLFLSIIFILLEMDYMIYKLRHDILDRIGD